MTRPSMRLWMGLSALFHLALGVVLFTASFASSPGQPSPVSDRVMMVRLTNDDGGKGMARPKKEDMRKPEKATPTLPSPLEGEGKGGGSLTQESGNEIASRETRPSENPESVTGQPTRTTHSDGVSVNDAYSKASQEPPSRDGDPMGAPSNTVSEAPPMTEAGVEDAYRPLVLAVLAREKRYPLFARQRGLEGIVEIAFTIHSDGRVSEPEVISSSRQPVLDQAALGMVKRLKSLPPPPEPAPLRFPARIQYRLDEP